MTGRQILFPSGQQSKKYRKMKTNLSGMLLMSTVPVINAVLFLFLFSTAASAAKEQAISARYSNPRGTEIKWYISVPESPPAAVIILQKIPPQTIVLHSSPPYHSYDRKTGTVKWLLTHVKPGKIFMTMKLDTPIRKKGEIRGEISWLMLDSGEFIW